MHDSGTPTGVRQHFLRYVPRRPYASDDPRRGVQVMTKRAALDCAHVQVQGMMRATLPIDLDSPHSAVIVREMDFPPPNLIMVNPENGHLHAGWQLAEPVPFTERGHYKPQKAFRDLQAQLSCLYGADPAYAGFLVKTPYHPRWQTLEGPTAPYSMGDLFDAMPAGIAAQVRARRERIAEGEGRHQTLFHTGRLWAYGEVKRAKRAGSFQAWEDRVLREFHMLNTFARPLPQSEVKSTAYTVARWTWQNADRLSGSVIGGQKRSAVKSWDRPDMTPDERKERMADGAAYTNAIRRAQIFDAITQAIGQLTAAGNLYPTGREIAVQAGVSLSSVRRFQASDRACKGN